MEKGFLNHHDRDCFALGKRNENDLLSFLSIFLKFKVKNITAIRIVEASLIRWVYVKIRNGY